MSLISQNRDSMEFSIFLCACCFNQAWVLLTNVICLVSLTPRFKFLPSFTLNFVLLFVLPIVIGFDAQRRVCHDGEWISWCKDSSANKTSTGARKTGWGIFFCFFSVNNFTVFSYSSRVDFVCFSCSNQSCRYHPLSIMSWTPFLLELYPIYHPPCLLQIPLDSNTLSILMQMKKKRNLM